MKKKIVAFCWQHVLLLISLWIMTLGVALCVRSQLGSSVISVLPYVFESAGARGSVPQLTIGQYTYVMNIILVGLQLLLLRRRFETVQLFQLVVGFMFGWLIDVNMTFTEWVAPDAIWQQAVTQFLGCTILGVGIAFEVRCGSVTMPGEGFPVALSRVTGMDFAKTKIMVDTTLVILGIIACYILMGHWIWSIVGLGTLFAMIYVGAVVKGVGQHIGWFDHILSYRPGFRRYIYGLARYIYHPHKSVTEYNPETET